MGRIILHGLLRVRSGLAVDFAWAQWIVAARALPALLPPFGTDVPYRVQRQAWDWDWLQLLAFCAGVRAIRRPRVPRAPAWVALR